MGDLNVSKLEVYPLSLPLITTFKTASSEKNPNNTLPSTKLILVFLSMTERLGRLFSFHVGVGFFKLCSRSYLIGKKKPPKQ